MRIEPGRALLGLAALAWLWMLGDAVAGRRMTCCAPDPTFAEDAVGWIAMVIAMMVPTAIDTLRDLVRRTYRARRWRAAGLYLFGFLFWWLVLGAVLMVARQYTVWHETRTAVVLCAVHALWTFVPARARWHADCERRILLYPVGMRADVDAFRQGAVHGAACVKMCWPLMVACAVTNHSLLLMIAGTILVIRDKRRAPVM